MVFFCDGGGGGRERRAIQALYQTKLYIFRTSLDSLPPPPPPKKKKKNKKMKII